MIYYKVKPDFDGKRIFKWNSNRDTAKTTDLFLIANELYTQSERNKIANADYFFNQVEVKKTKTYWFFGARFAM